MFSATRRWFRRNRTPIAIGVGVVGAGYVVTQYVLGKLKDARERMSSDRIAKENLRRRFEQNQEDCTFTVLALLPTATTSILETMETEQITYQIQQMKATKPGVAAAGVITSPPSIADTTMTEEDGRSMVSLQSESGVHASQVSLQPSQPSQPSQPPQPPQPLPQGSASSSSAPAPAPAASSSADGAQQQEGAAGPKRKTKRQLWDELTISSITRAYTLIYTLALLTMLTRIQLNLLGRRSYLSSVVSLATGSAQAAISLENNDDDNPDQAYGSDFDINRKYLTFSWWLLNKGWVDMMGRVEAAVRRVFGHLSPRDEFSLDTFRDLTREVRRQVETAAAADGGSLSETETGRGGGRGRWLSLLLPPTEQEEAVLRDSGVLGESAAASTTLQDSTVVVVSSPAATVSPPLRRLLDETSDLIESPAFAHVLSLLVDAGFSTLLDGQLARAAFGATMPAVVEEREGEGEGEGEGKGKGEGDDGAEAGGAVTRPLPPPKPTTVQLPKILSVLTRQAHAIGSGMPNEYLRAMEAVRDLEALAAVVYSTNWQNEMRDDDLGMVADAADVARSYSIPPPSSPSGATDPALAPAPAFPSAPRATPESSAITESAVLVTTESSFESAWQKAVEQR